MVRKVTIARFEEWKARAENIDAFFLLIEGSEGKAPMKFRDACFAIPVPYTLMYAHVHDTPELKARYDALLASLAHEDIEETVHIADGVKDETSPAKVAAAKIRIEARQQRASSWNRERYGEAGGKGGGITVLVDRSCGGAVRIGVADAGGNKAAVEIPSAEALAVTAEISKEI